MAWVKTKDEWNRKSWTWRNADLAIPKKTAKKLRKSEKKLKKLKATITPEGRVKIPHLIPTHFGNGVFCWNCGKTERLTKAHILPKSWKPKRNMIIPLCEPCHLSFDAGITCNCKTCFWKHTMRRTNGPFWSKLETPIPGTKESFIRAHGGDDGVSSDKN